MSAYFLMGNFFMKFRLNIPYINYRYHHAPPPQPIHLTFSREGLSPLARIGGKNSFSYQRCHFSFLLYLMNRAPRPPSVAPRRSQSLRKLIEGRPLLQPLSPSLRDVPLRRVVDEVLKHLIDIIDILLQEENSSNYIAYMRRSEQMNEELEKRIFLLIDEKIEGLRQQVLVRGAGPTKIKKVDANVHLKHERKTITQSILAHHRTSSASLFAHQRSHEVLKTSQNLRELEQNQSFGSILQEHDDKTIANSIQFHSISARISELQQIQSLNLKEVCASLEKKMAHNERDIHGLTQKYVDFRLKFEEKLDTNLEALWNVVTDIKRDIKY